MKESLETLYRVFTSLCVFRGFTSHKIVSLPI